MATGKITHGPGPGTPGRPSPLLPPPLSPPHEGGGGGAAARAHRAGAFVFSGLRRSPLPLQELAERSLGVGERLEDSPSALFWEGIADHETPPLVAIGPPITVTLPRRRLRTEVFRDPRLKEKQTRLEDITLRSLAETSKIYYAELIKRWITTGLPGEECLAMLPLEDRKKSEEFLTLYPTLLDQFNEKMTSIKVLWKAEHAPVFGPTITTKLLNAPPPPIEEIEPKSGSKYFENYLKEVKEVKELVSKLPSALLELAPAITEEDNPEIIRFQIRKKLAVKEAAGELTELQTLIKWCLSNDSLVAPFLKISKEVLKIKPPQDSRGKLRSLLNLIAHNIQKSEPVTELRSRMFSAINGINTSPIENLFTKADAKELGPLFSLIHEHLKHSFERFRLLPRYYATYGTLLRIIAQMAPGDTYENIKKVFKTISDRSPKGSTTLLYRATQAHSDLPKGQKEELKENVRTVHFLICKKEQEIDRLDGAHTLPLPVLFCRDSGALAELFKENNLATPPKVSTTGLESKYFPALEQLKQAIASYKDDLIQENLIAAFTKVFESLRAEDPNLFAWNAYHILNEGFLYAFSETEMFPRFVNTELDGLSEHPQILHQAFTNIIEEAFSAPKEETIRLTRQQGNQALAPLYKRTKKKGEEFTIKCYARYKQERQPLDFILAWMASNILSTLPQSEGADAAGGAGSA